jgi:hypothetical protein
MSHLRDRLRHTPKGADHQGAANEEVLEMKFVLMQHYGRVEGDVPPMTEWENPEDVKAHIDFQINLNAELRERGELVDAQALTGPEQVKIVLATDGAPAVTDGPFAESKELLAGWRMVDVESEERAIDIAALASEGPGPDGVPLRQAIEVREVMSPIEP